MKDTLRLPFDADKILQVKERTQLFTRHVVSRTVNDLTLNTILGSLQDHKRDCSSQGDPPRCRGRNPVDCDPRNLVDEGIETCQHCPPLRCYPHRDQVGSHLRILRQRPQEVYGCSWRTGCPRSHNSAQLHVSAFEGHRLLSRKSGSSP